MSHTKCTFKLLAFLALTTAVTTCQGESAISQLSGFDLDRIALTYPPIDEDSKGELAKLLYRLQKTSARNLDAKAGEFESLGDAIAIDAEIKQAARIDVPPRLVEFLEFNRMQVLVCQSDDVELRIVTIGMPAGVKTGDRIGGTGVAIHAVDGNAVVLAATHLKWFPATPQSPGWKLLSEIGVDVSLLADAKSRNRKPLLADDADAFYSLMAAAAQVGNRSSYPSPEKLAPAELLQDDGTLCGNWIQMNLETVQITRVSVTEPLRQEQLGADHYYQIDAMGDLDNVVVRIESPSGGEPVTFEHRYPVSIVVRELPEFLQQRIREQESGDAVVSNLKQMIAVDAFFYRVWSYSTDFMKQRGGGDQFGPLLIAASFQDREPTAEDPVGVGIIGWIAGLAMICGILVIWAWNRQLSKQDRQVREQRQQRESEQLQLP